MDVAKDVMVPVVVRGRSAGLDPALRERSLEKLVRLRRFRRIMRRVEVEFSEVRNPRVEGRHSCAVAVHLGRGSVQARAAAADPIAALDRVLDKVDLQLARHKERRIARRNGRARGAARARAALA